MGVPISLSAVHSFCLKPLPSWCSSCCCRRHLPRCRNPEIEQTTLVLQPAGRHFYREALYRFGQRAITSSVTVWPSAVIVEILTALELVKEWDVINQIVISRSCSTAVLLEFSFSVNATELLHPRPRSIAPFSPSWASSFARCISSVESPARRLG